MSVKIIYKNPIVIAIFLIALVMFGILEWQQNRSGASYSFDPFGFKFRMPQGWDFGEWPEVGKKTARIVGKSDREYVNIAFLFPDKNFCANEDACVGRFYEEQLSKVQKYDEYYVNAPFKNNFHGKSWFRIQWKSARADPMVSYYMYAGDAAVVLESPDDSEKTMAMVARSFSLDGAELLRSFEKYKDWPYRIGTDEAAGYSVEIPKNWVRSEAKDSTNFGQALQGATFSFAGHYLLKVTTHSFSPTCHDLRSCAIEYVTKNYGESVFTYSSLDSFLTRNGIKALHWWRRSDDARSDSGAGESFAFIANGEGFIVVYYDNHWGDSINPGLYSWITGSIQPLHPGKNDQVTMNFQNGQLVGAMFAGLGKVMSIVPDDWWPNGELMPTRCYVLRSPELQKYNNDFALTHPEITDTDTKVIYEFQACELDDGQSLKNVFNEKTSGFETVEVISSTNMEIVAKVKGLHQQRMIFKRIGGNIIWLTSTAPPYTEHARENEAIVNNIISSFF